MEEIVSSREVATTDVGPVPSLTRRATRGPLEKRSFSTSPERVRAARAQRTARWIAICTPAAAPQGAAPQKVCSLATEAAKVVSTVWRSLTAAGLAPATSYRSEGSDSTLNRMGDESASRPDEFDAKP